jgi:hypothetical protein
MRFRPPAMNLVVIAIAVLAASSAQAVYRDDFGSFFDYNAANGLVPVGTFESSFGPTASWSGADNPQDGGGPYNGSPYFAVFQANGADNNGNPTPGELVIEDANLHPNANGAQGIGWDGQRNNAPLLFKSMYATDDFDAVMKIDAQTPGGSSYASIVARLAGPAVGRGLGDGLDPSESFVTTGSLRTDAANPDNATILTQNIIDGVAQPEVVGDAAPSGSTRPLPLWVRMQKLGARINTLSSTDGVNWLGGTTVFNTRLSQIGQMLEVGPSFMMFGTGFGETEIDFFEIHVAGKPPNPGDYNGNGVVDAADYTVWRDNVGESGPLANEDASPGVIDAADYNVWKNHFGQFSLGAAAGQVTAVPEPTSLRLAVLMLISAAGARWDGAKRRGARTSP